MKLINLMEIAATPLFKFAEPVDWRPDDDCECEACMEYQFTSVDLWSVNVVEAQSLLYVKGKVGMRYVKRNGRS